MIVPVLGIFSEQSQPDNINTMPRPKYNIRLKK